MPSQEVVTAAPSATKDGPSIGLGFLKWAVIGLVVLAAVYFAYRYKNDRDKYKTEATELTTKLNQMQANQNRLEHSMKELEQKSKDSLTGTADLNKKIEKLKEKNKTLTEQLRNQRDLTEQIRNQNCDNGVCTIPPSVKGKRLPMSAEEM
jgi:uncharacterized membrane protein YhiD involved in acid resistance